MSTRVLVVDDSGIIVAGLGALLASHAELSVVGHATEGEAALALARQHRPDLVLLDLTMPGVSGFEICRRLREELPESRILVLTMHEDTGMLREALRAGASGYLIKRASEGELLLAIQAVMRGDLYVHPSLTRALVETTRGEGHGALTARETEVLRLVADGHTTTEVARKLGIGARTVEDHRASIAKKIGVSGRVAMVQYARTHGLL